MHIAFSNTTCIFHAKIIISIRYCLQGLRISAYYYQVTSMTDIVVIHDRLSLIYVKLTFILTKKIMKLVKKDAIIMHPLPRVNEISPKIDKDPRAKYFEQTYYGLMMRKAIIASILLKNF